MLLYMSIGQSARSSDTRPLLRAGPSYIRAGNARGHVRLRNEGFTTCDSNDLIIIGGGLYGILAARTMLEHSDTGGEQ